MSQSQFINVDGLTLYYVRDGQLNHPVLVFINALGTDLRIWDGLLPTLRDQYAILRYDKRGHGLSDAPSTPYTIRDHADDLAGLLAELDISRAILIGISVGGMIALDLAYQRPALVSGLVLCDTAPKIGTVEMWNERIAALEANGLDSMGEAILARWFVPDFAAEQPAAYRGYRNMLTRTPLAGYTGTCAAIRDADLTPTVSAIETNSLVLCGTEDLATTPEMGHAMAKALPQAEFFPIEGAAHLPCIEQPAIMADRIDRFLTGLNLR